MFFQAGHRSFGFSKTGHAAELTGSSQTSWKVAQQLQRDTDFILNKYFLIPVLITLFLDLLMVKSSAMSYSHLQFVLIYHRRTQQVQRDGWTTGDDDIVRLVCCWKLNKNILYLLMKPPVFFSGVSKSEADRFNPWSVWQRFHLFVSLIKKSTNKMKFLIFWAEFGALVRHICNQNTELRLSSDEFIYTAGIKSSHFNTFTTVWFI